MTETRTGAGAARRAGAAPRAADGTTGARVAAVGEVNFAEDAARLARRCAWDGRPAFGGWTHGRVHDMAARAASVLAGRGIGTGDRVLLALRDGAGWVVSFLAVARLGAIAIPVNPELPPADHAFMADDCGATLVIGDAPAGEARATTGAHARAPGGTRDDTPGRAGDGAGPARFGGVPYLDVDRLIGLAAAAGPAAAARVGPDAPLYAQYTSGTTGRPKAALHRHGDPAGYHRAAGEGVVAIGPDDVTLSVSKLYFAYGLGNGLVFPLLSGSRAVLVPRRLDPAEVGQVVRDQGVTILYAVPSLYAHLVAEGDPGDFASVRVAVSAGEALAPDLGDQAGELLGAPLLDQLGSTEAGHAFCSNTLRRHVRGTIGAALPGYELRLSAPDGSPAGDGTVGDLWVRGASLMTGYLGRPEETARALVAGWLRTGDRARRRPDGIVEYAGRADDLEMVGGITISPIEVERVLARHRGVAEVAVAAIADERGASRLRAFVRPRDPDPDPAVLEAELLALARGALAAYKIPRSVEVVGALPRTPSGKLRRFVIRNGTW